MWIDSSVALEIDTLGDVYRELDRLEDGSILGSNARIEYRRMRAQGSWWFAMALCKQGATTVIAKHEHLRRMLETLAPPGTDRGMWTAAVTWVFEPGGVFAGWRRRAHEGGAELSDLQMDRYMVKMARDHQLTLVTRDVEVIKKKGPKEGVTPIEPEQYAAPILPREEARVMFLCRLERATLRWIYNPPTGEESADINLRARAAATLLQQYRWIWEPAGTTDLLSSTSGLGFRTPDEPLFDAVLGRRV